MNNSSHFSGQWPKLILDVRVWFVWVLAILIMKVWPEYWKLALTITVFFMLANFFGMNSGMFIRFLRCKLFGGTKKSFSSGQRGGFLLMVISFTALMSIDNSYAEYELVDSVRYGLDWQRGYPGTRDEDVVEGFQSQLPLEIVLETILPKDIVLLWGDKTKKSMQVSWKGPKPWGHILRRLARENNLRMELQRQGNRLIIENATVGSFVYNHDADNMNSKLLGLTNKVWRLEKNKELVANLQEWASTEGWYIDWAIDREFVIDVNASFQGSLVSAVTDVIKSYRMQGVLGRVKVKAYTSNRTISIYQVGERK